MLDDIIHRPLLILNLCILGLVIVDVIHYGVEEISLFPFPYSVVDYCAAGCPPPLSPPVDAPALPPFYSMSFIEIFTTLRGCDELSWFVSIAEGRTR